MFKVPINRRVCNINPYLNFNKFVVPTFLPLPKLVLTVKFMLIGQTEEAT